MSRDRVDARVFLELPAESPSLGRASTLRSPRLRAGTHGIDTSRLGLTGGRRWGPRSGVPEYCQTSPAEGDPEASWALVARAASGLGRLNGMQDRQRAERWLRIFRHGFELRAAVDASGTRRRRSRYREQMLQRIRLAVWMELPPTMASSGRWCCSPIVPDINEELTRLDSHFAQFDDCLRSQEPLGRKTGSLAQEMNRVKHDCSKANDAAIAADVVLLEDGTRAVPGAGSECGVGMSVLHFSSLRPVGRRQDDGRRRPDRRVATPAPRDHLHDASAASGETDGHDYHSPPTSSVRVGRGGISRTRCVRETWEP